MNINCTDDRRETNPTAKERGKTALRECLMVSISLLLSHLSLFADEIVTISGKFYNVADVSRVEPDGLVIVTDAGIEKISFNDLSKEVQEKYGYDASAAANYRASVAAAAQQRHAASQQAKRQRVTATAKAAEQKAIEENAVTIRGKVLSVAKDGVLLQSAEIEQPVVKDVVVERSVLLNTPRYESKMVIERIAIEEPVFVYGVGRLVDGDIFAGKVHPVGRYSYVAALGNAKTVRAYATTEAVLQSRTQK